MTILCVSAPGQAAGAGDGAAYVGLRASYAAEQARLRRRLALLPRDRRRQAHDRLQGRLLRRFDRLTAAWLGTRWGLGPPQTTRPGAGKVNCGLFVALVLKHAGFNLPIWRFNRQAARMAIKSLSPPRAIRYFHRRPMSDFLAGVRRLGPGLFVIGLDFHIGFLRQHADGRLRFVHASYVSGEVVDEPAARAIPITTARYRVVGKILQPNMLRAWLSGERIRVLGSR